MNRIPVLLNRFSIGEICQEAYGGVDNAYYRNSLAECKNALITPFGNVKKRTGTKYIATANCDNVRFIPFVYSKTQAYVLMLCVSHGGDVNDNRIYFLTKDAFVADTSTELPYYISMPYTKDDDLNEIQYIQKDDIMYLAHKNHPIQKIIRHDEGDWSIDDVSFITDFIVIYGDGAKADIEAKLPPDFVEPNKVKLTYTVGGTEHTVTDDGNGKFPASNHITSTNSIDYTTGRLYVKFDQALDENKPVKVNFYNFENPYPSVVSFYNNRLLLANFSNHGQTIWASNSAAFEDLTVGATDSSGYMFTVASQENNEIRWINGLNKLLIGTAGSEFVVTGGTNGITPTSINVTKQSSIGSAHIQPVTIGNQTVYIQRYGTKVYVMMYDYLTDTYKSEDTTILNNDILRDGVVSVVYQQQPYSRIWFLTTKGDIKILTYEPAQKTIGWHTIETNGIFLTMASIPAITESYDRVYVAVKRGDSIMIEAFDNEKTDDYFDSFYVDCGGAYKDEFIAIDEINVPYLPNGTELSILTDTGIHPNVIVTDGKIKLQWKAKKIIYGLPYETYIKTLPIEFYGDGVNTINVKKKINYLTLNLLNSMGGEIGVSFDNTDTLFYRLLSYNMNELVPLFTGFKNIIFKQGYGVNASIAMKHTDPVPFNILGISCILDVSDN